WHYVCAGPGYF
ncbi:hypothetical protein cypCar_00009378, partial [Cyprinus carpio]